MNNTTIKFSVTSGDEKQFLDALKKEHVPFVNNPDGETEYKYYSVVPVYAENALQRIIEEMAKETRVSIMVKGFYQDPGTGEADVWTWKRRN